MDREAWNRKPTIIGNICGKHDAVQKWSIRKRNQHMMDSDIEGKEECRIIHQSFISCPPIDDISDWMTINEEESENYSSKKGEQQAN